MLKEERMIYKLPSLRVADALDELHEMAFLVLEEVNFVLATLVLDLESFAITLVDGLNLGLKFNHLVLKLGLLALKLFDLAFKVCFSMFSLELFAHSEGH